jgi:hypothetical protein
MSPKNGNKNNNKGFNWGRFSKTLSFWVFILLIPVVLIQLAGPRSEATTEINYTEYKTQLAKDNIKDVTVSAGRTSPAPSASRRSSGRRPRSDSACSCRWRTRRPRSIS